MADALVVAASRVQSEVVEVPLEQRLAPDTTLHKEILRRLNDRIRAGEAHVLQRHSDWIDADEHLRGFIDLSRSAKLADKTEDPTKREMPWGRAIAMPASYVTIWVRTMLVTQILDRYPQVQGRGPEDARGARLVEATLGYDLDQTRHLLNLFQSAFDGERYGTSVMGVSWCEEEGRIRERRSLLDGPTSALLPPWMASAARAPVERWGVRRQYNKAEVFDPYMIIPDPRVALARHQEGEFFGHGFFRAFLDLWALRKRPDGTGVYFNLERCRAMTGIRDDAASGRQSTGTFDSGQLWGDTRDPGFLKCRHLQIRLIPRWWKLGESEDPEVWWFTLAAPTSSEAQVIIRAHPSEYEHGEFTYHVGQSHPDLHAPWTPGTAELNDGLARMINWSMNAHIMNVMVALYNQVLADTELVEEADLRHPGPGRIVRLTPEGARLVKAGHPIGAFVQQMQTMDVTGGHVGLAQNLFQWSQRAFAANDTMQGLPTPDKRTLGEIQMATGSSSQRILMLAKLLDAGLLRGLYTQMIPNRFQLTRVAQAYRLTGDLAKQLGAEHVFVSPQDLWGNYDYRAISPTMPADPASFAETWMKLLEIGGKVPGMLSPGPDGRALNPRAIVEQIAQTMGVNYLDQFYVKVVPDEQLQRGVEAGNFVPAPAGTPGAALPGDRAALGPPLGLPQGGA